MRLALGCTVNLEKDKEVCKKIIEHFQEPVNLEKDKEKVCIGCFAFSLSTNTFHKTRKAAYLSVQIQGYDS
jgi:hypothetical protein